MQDLIGYDEIIEDSMRDVIYKVLKKVEKSGLKGGHYFVISFLTQLPGVQIPKSLLEKFPEEMIIVIQYQYESLIVGKDDFKISLSFSGNFERLVVPYSAITSFADPAINFGLKFNSYAIEDYEEEEVEVKGKKSSAKKSKSKKTTGKKVDLSAKVVSLDAFRKNKEGDNK